jgi:UDP-N-acetylmuramate-alanine ligase
MRPASLPLLFSREVRRIHCVGVGGMGVAPLAIYLRELGFAVSGEDDALTDDVRRQLDRAGVVVGALPEDCELVAYSSAIAASHPAHRAAAGRGLPLVRRGELLAEVVRGKKLVAVCGSHGKTTTTAMLVTALRAAGFPAGYVLGGLFADDRAPAAAGTNDWVVAEIDESDGTIERFAPTITVAVNLDWDHPDRYRELAQLERTFAELFARTRQAVLTSAACELSRRVVARLAGGAADAPTPRRATFGAAGDFAGVVTQESGDGLTLRLGGEFAIARAEVRARGAFNAVNATAALAAAQLMGAPLRPALLAGYPAVRRRQAVLLAEKGVTAIEDYAHHPAEIRALLGSLRERVGGEGRLIVVFQPHRFSRTAQFKREFATALTLADRLHLLDVYAAGERPLAGGTTADVLAEVQRQAPELPVRHWTAAADEFAGALAREVQSGDWVAFVGAGDIDRAARRWVSTYHTHK